jgi:peptidoglycan/xylan/chitin deacetylase (PgdA/CDA1 family)
MMRYLIRNHPQAEPAYRRILRWALASALHHTGLALLLNRLCPRPGALILFGHRVADDFDDLLGGVPPDLFERQIAWLARHFRFLSMDELVERIHRNKPVPANSVVLTLDDGYVDNYTNALPVLERHRVPATIYLVTDSIETGELPWPQRLAWVLVRTNRDVLVLNASEQVSLPLKTMPERVNALKALKEIRKSLSMSEQLNLFQSVVDQCGVPTPRGRMLNWDQVREMRRRGITFGSHTVHHPFMNRLPLEDARRELIESKRVIEERLGERVHHFCFPHGSYGEAVGRLAQETGYESYFISGGLTRTNDHTRSPFQLRRLGLSDEELPVLALATSRLYTDLLRPGSKQVEKQ